MVVAAQIPRLQETSLVIYCMLVSYCILVCYCMLASAYGLKAISDWFHLNRKKIKMFLLISTSNFHIFECFLVPVDSLKCVNSENTEFFESSPILSGFFWLRSKNGTIFYQNQTIIFPYFGSV